MSVCGAIAPLVLVVSLAAVGCGGGGSGSPGDGAPAGGAQTGDGPVHVHGLGINPADGALMIATHTGVFRAAKTSSKAIRVGDSEQDTMGFTVVGPNRFLGSGHPGPGDERPALLGLIESRDGGRSWRSISLLGETDFHVLRSARGRVFGFDVASGQLMVGSDGGREWAEREPPAPLVDLAVDPRDVRHLIAAGEGGLYISANEGRGWRPLGGEIGLLAWPRPGRLYIVDAGGVVRRSSDGRHWRRVGQIGGQPAAFAAATTNDLYVALGDATIKQSGDGGRSWTVRSTP